VFPVVAESVPVPRLEPQWIVQLIDPDSMLVAVKTTLPLTGTEAGCGEMLITVPKGSVPVGLDPQAASKSMEASPSMPGTLR
jgi:hypothetical protein